MGGINRKLGGDAALYTLSAAFAGVTAFTSTLLPHRAWGALACWGYLLAAFAVFAARRNRLWVTAVTWVLVALVPAVVEAVQRAAGRTDRAQDEVLVVENAGIRMLHTGSPYLSRGQIAGLPAADRLLAYTPYQPGMAVFGLPRAVLGAHWFTDARVWFAVVGLAALVFSGVLLARHFPAAGLVRAAQMATVLPLSALTLATGGDDIPVLCLTLLAFALAARGGSHWALCGVAVGAAGALKLFAWPVVLVLLVLAVRQGAWRRYAVGALAVPLLAFLPTLKNPAAFLENVIRFPSGQGLVASPAQSPLPGHLIAAYVPAGRTIAQVLLLLAGVAVAGWLLRRPPDTAGEAALVSAIGLTAAIMLTPSTRFGYLIYPVAYVAAWSALRRTRADPDVALERTAGATV